ncbi:N-acetyltransferase GCN5 [Oceanobacillus oncorhynchi subsp. incaldanensis]|uniref:Ribosomal-protein-alanine N-acetyltransferase n=1 Tax=Oceanobacillus oncorhynchi TaxID=545501 RepID=A0A0A1MJ22_9BACI|nr:GNAT family N-acetyltransferase [Oceanobacillus oncorhynchi]GIO17706.1 N-acetyltransferase GCN5 [Oceanobacillus oncorhynchi subsp. incaldanensis]CEI83088.1 ribosomal-protein-alanine N-acetyltransferase [Oceanobacillus oncorhynchi]
MLDKTMEELSLNNWQPLSTLLYDGWVLRFANGYTKRANSIQPILYSTLELEQKIDACEKIYAEKNLRTTFKITPFIQPENLDDILKERAYSLVDYTSVQTIALDTISEPALHRVRIDEKINREWLDCFCQLNNVEEKNKDTMMQMLSNIVTQKCFISLYYNEEVIACCLGVIEREYIGLYDIVTDSQYRNQGFAEQLILHLLKWGKDKGAKYSYLAVLLNNESALRLYSKIGFSEVYRYWYRVKENK